MPYMKIIIIIIIIILFHCEDPDLQLPVIFVLASCFNPADLYYLEY